MKRNDFKKMMSMILIAAMIMIAAVGCTKKDNSGSGSTAQTVTEAPADKSAQTVTEAPADKSAQTVTEAPEDASATENNADTETGNDNEKTQFTFIVVDRDGNETTFDIATDKATVGEALLDENLIEGEEGAYGLYVKKVNGIEAIYENDGTYWAFYINGEYAMTGVDTTDVENGAVYMFKVEG